MKEEADGNEVSHMGIMTEIFISIKHQGDHILASQSTDGGVRSLKLIQHPAECIPVLPQQMQITRLNEWSSLQSPAT